MKKSNKKQRNAFSLLETVIAMALIAMIFSMSVSTVLMSSSVSRKTENTNFFVGEISNLLECYKVSGKDGFCKNCEKYLQIKIEFSSFIAQIYYKSDYTRCISYDEAYFILTIDLNGGFRASVTDKDMNNVFSMREKYVSRFDLAGGGQ